MAGTLVVFHRCGGKSLGYPPNTLLTAKWALGYGAKAIEYDIVLCQDGNRYKVVGIEPKLLKQSGLNIDNLQWSDVQRINTGNERFGAASPVTLEEMLANIDPLRVAHQIHIKGNNPDTLNVLLPKVRDVSNCLLTTFDIGVIRHIKSVDASIPVGWIVKPKGEKGSEGAEDLTAAVAAGSLPAYTSEELQNIVAEAQKNNVQVVILCGPRIQSMSDVEQVRGAGFGVGAWGVATDLGLARRLIDFGLDRFTLDNPEQL